MALIPYRGVMPKIAEGVFIAEGAQIIGDVTIGAGSSVWYNTVIRGDVASVTIGQNVNVQDNSTVHVGRGVPCVIHDNVSIGHGAVVHGCTVEEGAMIAIHATVLTGAVVGAGSIVGAGAMVGEKKTIPPRSLAVGIPARVIRELTDEDVAMSAATARNYAQLSKEHIAESGAATDGLDRE
ncbi:MAG TPA: gamma carbonic anhydrase family protein [Chloroflexota bacterium]|nr:gamma carbonic anhydrase family protein [Chloroflexota bacterium]HEX2987712.1 gamma carbonic anhydrase family protein [Chloroflexota bacterium]